MNSLDTVASLSMCHPDGESARILKQFLDDLHGHGQLDLVGIYELSYRDFELVIEAMREWRLHRFIRNEASAVSPSVSAH